MKKDLVTLDEEETREESESSPDEPQPAKTLSTKYLAAILKHLNDVSVTLDENTPEHQRSCKAIKEANHAFSCYTEFQ
jgi:hypothetical protein